SKASERTAIAVASGRCRNSCQMPPTDATPSRPNGLQTLSVADASVRQQRPRPRSTRDQASSHITICKTSLQPARSRRARTQRLFSRYLRRIKPSIRGCRSGGDRTYTEMNSINHKSATFAEGYGQPLTPSASPGLSRVEVALQEAALLFQQNRLDA